MAVAPSPHFCQWFFSKKVFSWEAHAIFQPTQCSEARLFSQLLLAEQHTRNFQAGRGHMGLAFCPEGRYTDWLPIWQRGRGCRPNGARCKHQKTKEIPSKALYD